LRRQSHCTAHLSLAPPKVAPVSISPVARALLPNATYFSDLILGWHRPQPASACARFRGMVGALSRHWPVFAQPGAVVRAKASIWLPSLHRPKPVPPGLAELSHLPERLCRRSPGRNQKYEALGTLACRVETRLDPLLRTSTMARHECRLGSRAPMQASSTTLMTPLYRGRDKATAAARQYSKSTIGARLQAFARAVTSLPAARSMVRSLRSLRNRFTRLVLCSGLYDASFFALYSSHRFLVASIMRSRPAALSLRFLVTPFAGAPLTPFMTAQRFRCASAIRARASGLRLRPFRAGGVSGDAADLGGRPRRPVPSPSMDRTCCMCCSIVCFCASNPCKAAFRTSGLKLPVCLGMYSDYAAYLSYGYK
jgi:hypothetical protein